MPTNEEIQRAAALAAANRARDAANARQRNGGSAASVRAARDEEHSAWTKYRKSR